MQDINSQENDLNNTEYRVLTRRLVDWLRHRSHVSAQYVWHWRLTMIAILAIGIWYLYTVSPLSFLILMVIGSIVGLPIIFFIDLPYWTLGILSGVALSVTALIDLVTRPSILSHPCNRIVFVVLGIDGVITAFVVWAIYIF